MPWIEPKVWTALLLTGMGAAGTALGGLAVVAQPKMNFRTLGILQGFAAGLMLCISVFDLMPAAVEEVGFAIATAWFYGGVVFFAAVVYFIPEPPSGHFVLDDDGVAAPATSSAAGADLDLDLDRDGGAGGVVTATGVDNRAGLSGSSANARKSATASSPALAALSPTVAPITRVLSDPIGRRAARKRVLMSGLITAIGIALHNFPEGVAVFLASLKSPAVGLTLAAAIALHNVPEGIAVALPVYFATGSRWQGFWYAAVSGLAEPAAVIMLAIAMPANLDKQLVEKLLAAVGGIMAFLAVSELLPLSLEHAGRRAGIASLFVGMAVMSGNLFLLDHWVMGGHGHGHSH